MEVKRKSYTIRFKSQVLKKLEENGGNISQTSRDFKIDRKIIRCWLSQRDLIVDSVRNRAINISSRRNIRGGKAQYPELEDAIMEFIRDERKFGRSVNGKMIQRKALVLFPKLYPMPCASFKASKGWLRRMLLRNDLSFRRVTSVGQKVPSDAPERCDQFLRKMQSIRGYDYIWNMDETPRYFDMPESSTIDTKGVQTVKVKTTGHEKLRFTAAVLSAGIKIAANEVKAVRLPPMIIFKTLVKPPSGNFPPHVMV